MERGEFVAEGHMQLGPTEYYFVFLEGEYLGKLLCDHFGVPEEHGYTEVGRVRITVELRRPRTRAGRKRINPDP
jgi:hypothetical protein